MVLVAIIGASLSEPHVVWSTANFYYWWTTTTMTSEPERVQVMLM